jgi:segregation and condensation protein B
MSTQAKKKSGVGESDATELAEASFAGEGTAEASESGANGAASLDAEALEPLQVQNAGERSGIIEALIYVSDEPLNARTIAEVLKEDETAIQGAIDSLVAEFNGRGGGLQLREVAGGWQFATRPEFHEHVRAFLKSRPSAKLSLASLETLAVIAYKQPITVPEILDIRGVQSPSSIKTLLDKKLIVAKGRKEAAGRPMMYGTSKEFLIQFGLKDLSELPSIEDFQDLAGGIV